MTTKCVDLGCLLISGEYLRDSHLILGQSSSFVRTNHINATCINKHMSAIRHTGKIYDNNNNYYYYN